MAVNFDRAMIELVREIRRRAPANDKPGIKLANPEILEELAVLYHKSKDIVFKTLIKELFERAGNDSLENFTAETESKKFQSQIYRGQAKLVESKDTSSEPAAEADSEEKAKKRKTRIYRGQVIEI